MKKKTTPKKRTINEAAATLGRLGGIAKSLAKKKTARENGKLGGRPVKDKPTPKKAA